MPDAQQTWPNLERHFTRMESDRLETATTSTAGYTNMAYIAAQIPLPNNMAEWTRLRSAAS
jgi:hypothetical protein